MTSLAQMCYQHIVTRTRTFRLAHNQSLAHHCTRTFHIHSHIMTGPLAHFDSHLTNHSHITVLAHYDQTTRTFRLAHQRTRTL